LAVFERALLSKSEFAPGKPRAKLFMWRQEGHPEPTAEDTLYVTLEMAKNMKTLSLAALVLASAAWFPSVSMAQDKQEVPVAVAASTAVALDYYDGVWKRPATPGLSGVDMHIKGDSGTVEIWGTSGCFRGKMGLKIVSRDAESINLVFKTTDIAPQCVESELVWRHEYINGKDKLTNVANSGSVFTKN
jgi:hypothetical protein